MAREIIQSPLAPKALGPYAQAVKHQGLLFLSGQLGLEPKTGALKGDDVLSQTRQALSNLEAVCAEANTHLHHALKLTLYLRDLNQFGVVNDLLANTLKQPYPARSTVEVSRLPKDALIEIDAIVAVDAG
ncbi:MAG: Rid family detoxifying hydrolase [Pseudomonadales bacterium]|jgi:2-iminobutanoate/2-iminopropanoate deaminase